eukprot:TRINITY_DN625_c0_g2_i1.p1 TRINITY_DN625_c0_g2~~TRINITY_DN625_c0_g2_i1.p1  ORF type:complete len:1107 (-),score=320.84 TRINITY_DN625_c0_g2_i1:366-3686(-)
MNNQQAQMNQLDPMFWLQQHGGFPKSSFAPALTSIPIISHQQPATQPLQLQSNPSDNRFGSTNPQGVDAPVPMFCGIFDSWEKKEKSRTELNQQKIELQSVHPAPEHQYAIQQQIALRAQQMQQNQGLSQVQDNQTELSKIREIPVGSVNEQPQLPMFPTIPPPMSQMQMGKFANTMKIGQICDVKLETPYSNVGLVKLRELCRERNLSQSGIKVQILQRLMDHDIGIPETIIPTSVGKNWGGDDDKRRAARYHLLRVIKYVHQISSTDSPISNFQEFEIVLNNVPEVVLQLSLPSLGFEADNESMFSLGMFNPREFEGMTILEAAVHCKSPIGVFEAILKRIPNPEYRETTGMEYGRTPILGAIARLLPLPVTHLLVSGFTNVSTQLEKVDQNGQSSFHLMFQASFMTEAMAQQQQQQQQQQTIGENEEIANQQNDEMNSRSIEYMEYLLHTCSLPSRGLLDKNACNAIHYGASSHFFEALKLLINNVTFQGIFAQDINGRTPLHHCMISPTDDSIKSIQLLLNAGPGNYRLLQDRMGCTPLHIGFQNFINSDTTNEERNMKVLELLFSDLTNTIVNAVNEKGQNIIHVMLEAYSLAYSSAFTVSSGMKHCPSKRRIPNEIIEKFIDSILSLMKPDLRMLQDQNGQTVLHYVCGLLLPPVCLEIFKKLIHDAPSLFKYVKDKDDNTCLHLLCGSLEKDGSPRACVPVMLTTLLDGCDPSFRFQREKTMGSTSLHALCRNRYSPDAILPLLNGLSPEESVGLRSAADKVGRSCLYYVCDQEFINEDSLKLILQNMPANFRELIDLEGKSCLFAAIRHNASISTLKLLLENSSLNFRTGADNTGSTTLHHLVTKLLMINETDKELSSRVMESIHMILDGVSIQFRNVTNNVGIPPRALIASCNQNPESSINRLMEALLVQNPPLKGRFLVPYSAIFPIPSGYGKANVLKVLNEFVTKMLRTQMAQDAFLMTNSPQGDSPLKKSFETVIRGTRKWLGVFEDNNITINENKNKNDTSMNIVPSVMNDERTWLDFHFSSSMAGEHTPLIPNISNMKASSSFQQQQQQQQQQQLAIPAIHSGISMIAPPRLQHQLQQHLQVQQQQQQYYRH